MKDIERSTNFTEEDDEAFIKYLQEMLSKNSGEIVSVIDDNRLLQIKMSLESFKHTFNDQPVSISYKLNKPSLSMGVIYANGKSLMIKNKTQFLKACKLASNVDIYPKTDGTVLIALTFHGLTKRLK